jgi:hypothetical protein
VLDGTFLRDPLYATLIAALRPSHETLYNLDTYGIAAGAAFLAGHDTRTAPASLSLSRPTAFAGDHNALTVYAERWRDLSNRTSKSRNLREV